MKVMVQSPAMPGKLRIVRARDDLDFASRCVSGERAALRELFQREKERVHTILFRMIGSNAHIDDLVQDAFLEIFRSLPTFRGEASLATWIDRCTVRIAYLYFARRSRTTWLERVPEAISAAPSSEEHAILREAVRHLYAELDRLEPRQRIAFVLHTIDGRPLQDVARIMGATLVATKTRIWRARRTIEKRARRDPLLSEYLTAAAREGGKCGEE
jgi:RNA polymerase sigma-70 factor (ECF subfamily)